MLPVIFATKPVSGFHEVCHAVESIVCLSAEYCMVPRPEAGLQFDILYSIAAPVIPIKGVSPKCAVGRVLRHLIHYVTKL